MEGLKLHKILWKKHVYENDVVGLEAGLTDIKNQLNLGRPVIVDTSIWNAGHTLVISGYKKTATCF